MKYAIYNKDTGVIESIYTGTSPGLQGDFIELGNSSTVTDDKFYVKEGVILAKPEMQLSIDKYTLSADTVDFITVSNVPDNCLITTNNTEQYTVSDVLEFSTDVIGQFKLRFECFPFIGEEVVFDAY